MQPDPGRELFLKLAALIIGIGLVCCVQLSLRQARLQAANEFAEARLRVRMLNENISTLRAEVALEISPDRIKQLRRELGVTTTNWLESLDPLAEPPTDDAQGQAPLETAAATSGDES